MSGKIESWWKSRVICQLALPSFQNPSNRQYIYISLGFISARSQSLPACPQLYHRRYSHRKTKGSISLKKRYTKITGGHQIFHIQSQLSYCAHHLDLCWKVLWNYIPPLLLPFPTQPHHLTNRAKSGSGHAKGEVRRGGLSRALSC